MVAASGWLKTMGAETSQDHPMEERRTRKRVGFVMKNKKPKDSAITMAILMLPEDANPAGNVHGGVIMKHIDSAAGVVAVRHSSANVVTASIDRLDFHSPVYVGNLLTVKASINIVGSTSMEIGVRVEAEDLMTGKVRHTASAYLTFVALDENHRPKRVPGLMLEGQDEIRRNREARARRASRLAERTKEKECQKDLETCSL
jgi:acyl-CoA hydrolase